jgi:Asp-tRNA(Asn)/Glu-tRNA(Gln) amidotransferase A subunit family amidase
VSDEFPTSAADIAWNVRNNLISAADILERHLAAIDAREGDIHAFNLVLADEARARPPRSTTPSRSVVIRDRSPGCPSR